MALLSAQTARKYNRELPIQVITNVGDRLPELLPFWDARTDRWTTVDDAVERNRDYKTNLGNMVEFEKAIYLDCDTLVTGGLERAWLFLDYFDLCLRTHRGKQRHRELSTITLIGVDARVQDLPHWNGGVVAFRNNEVARKFFLDWRDNFRALGVKFDQPALAKTIFESECRVLSLDERWNGGFRELNDDVGGIPIVVHYHSALDHRIEERLRFYADLMERSGVAAARDRIESYILQKNRMRRRSEGARWLFRRLYRRFWHNRHAVTG
jgi:hypothetical protein